MKIFYDCEFAEDGQTILPLSWGGVREDGQELYIVIHDRAAVDRAVRSPWLLANVIPFLPLKTYQGVGWTWDSGHPHYRHLRSPAVAAAEIAGFVMEHPDPQLWAWYGAYDHVMTCQLFGRMVDLPPGFPMFTCDLKQEADRIAQYDKLAKDLPELTEVLADGVPVRREHNALWDAREVAHRFRYLRSLGVPGGHL